MARINRRPSANRRSVMQTEEAPQQFNPQGEYGGPSKSFMHPFHPKSPGFMERMKDPSFVRDLERFRSGSFGPAPPSGPTSFSPGGGVPSGGPDTGIAKIIALSKPGALAPSAIPTGVAGVKTSGMRFGPSVVPGGLLGGLGVGPDY